MELLDWLGKEVEVKMDRPLGSKHPKWKFIYPVNYGYIPGVIGGDGEEFDAYVLGEFRPLDTFKGVVKAVIHRTSDNEDKLVVMAKDRTYTAEQIYALTEFQEGGFDGVLYTSKKDKGLAFKCNRNY